MNSQHIAIFGGSFNPPHLAHRQVMDFLKGSGQFDEVWMSPSYDHPFEKNLAGFEDRKKMCLMTIRGLSPKVKLSPIEKETGKKPSYMIDAILALKKNNPRCHFSIVVGSDCKCELPKWKEIDRLKNEAGFFFIPRPGFEESPFMNISSTEIRRLIKEGRPYSRYLVPEAARYISEKGLYLEK